LYLLDAQLLRAGAYREVYAEVPPRVEYSVTEFGQTLEPVLDALVAWGLDYIDENPHLRAPDPPTLQPDPESLRIHD
jgi:hypothetical protein